MYKQELYKYLARFVFENTGIFYPEKDFYRLDSRINKLLKIFDIENEDELLKKMRSATDIKFKDQVIDICTNNETYFFRDEKPFNALKEHIFPELVEQKKVLPLNIWSCASSSGQEALSILMTLFEKYPQDRSIQLDATDISKTILDKARSGVYNSLEVQRGLPIQMLVKYFEQGEENSWKVKEDLLKKVRYSEFNLFSNDFPPNKYHVIFCRNVLIYQNSENKNQILEKLFCALKPGGYLILGAGESLIGSKVELKQKSLNGTMVFQRSDIGSVAAA